MSPSDDTWFTGFTDQPPAQKPLPGPPGWVPGQVMRTGGIFACCPHCGSGDISPRPNGRDISRWVCNHRACGHPFKMVHQAKRCYGLNL